MSYEIFSLTCWPEGSLNLTPADLNKAKERLIDDLKGLRPFAQFMMEDIQLTRGEGILYNPSGNKYYKKIGAKFFFTVPGCENQWVILSNRADKERKIIRTSIPEVPKKVRDLFIRTMKRKYGAPENLEVNTRKSECQERTLLPRFQEKDAATCFIFHAKSGNDLYDFVVDQDGRHVREMTELKSLQSEQAKPPKKRRKI